MIRKTVLLVACMTLAGCTTYGYRGGSGDYYYGSPGTTYRYYGAPYGSIGYGRGYGWYGGAGYGAPYGYGPYGGWNGYPYGARPYGYYGGGYYRPPVIVRPVYPRYPQGPDHHRPPRPGDQYPHARPESGGRPVYGGGRPVRPGETAPGSPGDPGNGRPGGPGPGWSGGPERVQSDRPARPGGWGGRPAVGESGTRPQGRPGFVPPGRPERVDGGAPAPRPQFQRQTPQAAPMSRPAPARIERAQGEQGERRTTVTTRELEPI